MLQPQNAAQLEDTLLDALAIVHSLTKTDTPSDLRVAYTQALRLLFRRLNHVYDETMRGGDNGASYLVSDLYN
jgi:hypothetical protein